MLFYGQAINSIYTTQNVYWLRQGNGVTMGTTATAGTAATGSLAASFPLDRQHPPGDVRGHRAAGARSGVRLLVLGSRSSPATRSTAPPRLAVAAPNVGNVPAAARTLTAHLMRAPPPAANNVQVTLNGAALGYATWSGITAYDATFAASGLNASGTNTVTLTALPDPRPRRHRQHRRVYLQSFDVGYEPGAFSAPPATSWPSPVPATPWSP